MKAIIAPKFGSPDVLQLKDVDKPAPGDDEVLVKVVAASLNPLDWHLLRGKPFLARLAPGFGLLRPKKTIPGVDMAGRVEAVGRNVTQFRPGDEVFGTTKDGALAEYARATEDALEMKPAGTTFEEAAAVPIAAFTALQALRDKGQVRPGQKVLVNGASGGVGTFAVEIAKHLGADVTGVCSTRNLDLVRSIGADRVIDYTQEDFARSGRQYDLIIDSAASRSFSDYKRALAPRGIYVSIGYSPLLMLQIALRGRWTSRGKKMLSMLAHRNKKDLAFLRELLESRAIVPVIDRRYPLSETPAALRYLEDGHARGKVVITVGMPGDGE